MGFTAETPTPSSSSSQGSQSRSKETRLKELQPRIIRLVDGLTEDNWNETIQQVKDDLGIKISDKAAAIHHARTHEATIDEIYPDGPAQEPERDIANLVVEMRSVDLVAHVHRIGSTTEFSRDDGSTGKGQNLTIKDDTAKTQVAFWDDQRQVLDKLEQGDRISIEDGYTPHSISDYQKDRFGVPEIKLEDRTEIYVDTGEGWEQIR